MAEVISTIGDINADWLTDALKAGSGLKSRVKSVSVEQIGAGVGLMGTLARLSITYEGDEALPSTMVAKFAAQNENKAVAQLLDFYNRETNFYNIVGDDCPFRVPRSYFGKVDQDTYDFVLLMEDLGDVAPNDQIVGSSAEEAQVKIRNIARLHAKYWNQTGTDENSWMYDFMSPDEMVKLRDMVYGPALEPTLVNFASHFEGDDAELCRAVGERYAELRGMMSDNYSFLHGDYRQDNFIYAEGDDEAIVMDWQISGAGFPIFDVAYFVCQSLQVDLRREVEPALLQLYLDELAANGVQYDKDTAMRDYRVMILFCLVYPITVCGSLDLANERGRALAECMLDRNLAAARDLNCAELLA